MSDITFRVTQKRLLTQRKARYWTTTKTMQSIAGRTKALTNVITMEANNKTVATIRTGLNIFSSCVLNPLHAVNDDPFRS